MALVHDFVVVVLLLLLLDDFHSHFGHEREMNLLPSIVELLMLFRVFFGVLLGHKSSGESLKNKASLGIWTKPVELQFGPFQYEDHFNNGPSWVVFLSGH